MSAVTRFGLEGYGVRRAGSFASKATTNISPEPVLRQLRMNKKGRQRVLTRRVRPA